MTTNTPHQQSVDAEIQKHVDELLRLGWQFKGRGLYPTWGRGEHIHHRFSSKRQATTNDWPDQ